MVCRWTDLNVYRKSTDRLATSGNCVISALKNASAPTITSSTWRRIRMGTARIIRAGFPIDPRCYIRVRRRSSWRYLGSIGKPKGYQMESAFFCGKTRAVFGVEVYRKSTGVLDLGKSAAKAPGNVSRPLCLGALAADFPMATSPVTSGRVQTPKSAGVLREHALRRRQQVTR